MRCLTAAFVLLTVTSGARAADPAPDVRRTIDRAFQFLAKDALAWKREYKCVSCHHAGLVLWALREGKARGYAVDEPVVAELTKLVAAGSDGSNGLQYRTAAAPKAISLYAVMMSLGLEAGGGPDAAAREKLKVLLNRIKIDQTDDGSWQAWPGPGPRPPLFASAQVMTTLATLALWPDAGGRAAAEKGVQWLAKTTPEDDAQADAVRLILWRRAARPAEQTKPLVQRILGRQKPDGGWSQTKEMASDPFATGQALYALADSGLKPDDPAVRKAHAFLAKTQRPDGSWAMTSRSNPPGGPGSKSLVPITGAGTAWATLGLIRMAPNPLLVK